LTIVKAPAWPAPVAELLLGKRDPASVIGAAADTQQQCEAQFFAGEWQLAKGARAEAAKALETAAANCPGPSAERNIAVDDLRDLRQ
jgi:rhomboid protease GluP